MIAARRIALREGREAALAPLRGQPAPASPYRKGTKRHTWWTHGAERAARLVKEIEEIGA